MSDSGMGPRSGRPESQPDGLSADDTRTRLERMTQRRWDFALTVGLAFLGIWSVISTFESIARLGDTITQVYATIGIDGGFSNWALGEQVGFWVNAVRVIALIWALAVAWQRLNAGKVAFWVLLVAAAVGNIVFMIAAGWLLLNDPTYLTFLDSQLPVTTPAP